MSDIFISYASQDKPRAQELATALAQFGWSVWWDRQIPPGKTFDQVIEEELTAARCVVVLWSKDSVQSRWVKTEASEAAQRDILVPALISDNIKIPFEFSRIQAAKLVDWHHSTPHQDFDLFIKAIENTLGKAPKPAAKPWEQTLHGLSLVLGGKTTASQGWQQTLRGAFSTTKKIALAIVVLLAILVVIGLLAENNSGTSSFAAQYCCDWGGVRRCILASPLPAGSPCVCYGQGSGVACP